jgi:Domain of unknown function (DUF397)
MTSDNPQHQQPIPGADKSVPAWRKASGSSNNGGCVEVALLGEMIAVRDSKDPDKPAHLYTRREFHYFLDGAKAGEFDDLL